MTADATLLLCPFCGGEPLGIEHPPHKHVIATFMPDHPGSYSIECTKCGVGLIAATQQEAAARWNTRHQYVSQPSSRTAIVPIEELELLTLECCISSAEPTVEELETKLDKISEWGERYINSIIG